MKRLFEKSITARAFFFCTVAFCALLAVLTVFLAVGCGGNNFYSFSEPVLTLDDGWTLTDSDKNSQTVSLPETIAYGKDGKYTLSCKLPTVGGRLSSPALRFYSNYVDISIALNGRTLYSFPKKEAEFSGATGNTYHFVRLPAYYAGKTLTVTLRCQLGSDITYLLTPPLLGSKATMLSTDVMRSLPSFMLSGCMCILAIGLGVLYFLFRKRLDLNNATLYTAIFTLLFAIYVFCETSFAQLVTPNGYMLCFITLMLLALVPIPLIGVFLNAVSSKFKPVMRCAMMVCSVNFIAQLILNFTGVKSVRVMLPATHAVILLTITAASFCLLLSDRAEKPAARRSFISAIPMIAGGTTDIVLINLNNPSLNNCFWFAIGVTIFIIYQLSGFVTNYFTLYRTSLEAKLLTDMAYHDVLAGIDNRNAYERKLKELSDGASFERLCCIVADINDLKVINDTLGHQAGDAAIAEVGAILRACMPERASYFRTGGDEFVILLEEYDEERTKLLAEQFSREAARRGSIRSVPISLAVGFGQYAASDGNVIDFIRRVDTLMYECKRSQKNACR